MDMSERLKKIRSEFIKTFTQEDFAKLLGVSKMTVGRWERNESAPDYENLHKILKEFPEINPAWLLTGEGEMRRGECTQKHQQPTHVLDLELLNDIIVETLSYTKQPDEDWKTPIVIATAMMEASKIIEKYKKEKGLPTLSAEDVHRNHIDMLFALKEELTIAEERDKKREG